MPGLVADLRRRATPHAAAAERVLSTAHKAKGLEWPRVRLAADFPRLEELDAVDRDGLPCLTPEERDQELHLLYVAATRARQQLEPNAAVLSCLARGPLIRANAVTSASSMAPPPSEEEEPIGPDRRIEPA